MSLSSVIERLRARSRVGVESYLRLPLDVSAELAPLRSAVAQLAKESDVNAQLKPAAWRIAVAKWRRVQERDLRDFDSREIRALCSSPISLESAFVSALGALGVLHERRLWLEGLISQYLLSWRTMEEPETVEHLLTSAVKNCKLKSSRIAMAKEKPDLLFSPRAADWLADCALNQSSAVTDVLGAWGIEPGTGLGTAALNAAPTRWATAVRRGAGQLDKEEAIHAFEYLTECLLSPALVSPAAAGKALSAIVLSPAVDRDVKLLEAIQFYVIESERFGDPRLPANASNWSVCDAEARQKVAGWFSKQALDFFFKHTLLHHQDPHRRRQFWERYLGMVVDCQVVLSPTDDNRLRADLEREHLSYAKMDGSNDVSAFMMKFRGATELIVIEFSKPNNAIWVHDATAFERITRGGLRKKSARFHWTWELKNSESKVDSLPHVPPHGWQSRVAMVLAQHGIRRA